LQKATCIFALQQLKKKKKQAIVAIPSHSQLSIRTGATQHPKRTTGRDVKAPLYTDGGRLSSQTTIFETRQ
jgi:hypothetical protein